MIEYKPSSENSTADSLSRIYEETGLEDHNRSSTAVSTLIFAFLDVLLRETNPWPI